MNYAEMKVKKIYRKEKTDPAGKERVATFYFPFGLDNNLLLSAMIMQYNLHIGMNKHPKLSEIINQLTELFP